MRKEPIISDLVQNLILEVDSIKATDMSDLCSLFFNLRELAFYGKKYTNYDPIYSRTLGTLPWTETIRYINENSTRLFTYHVLKQGVCPVLTNISICGKTLEAGDELIAILGNAPALTVLSLRDYNLTLFDLESIHNKAPLLTSLSLYATGFTADKYPATVTPTNTITALNLSDLYITNDEEYLAFQKYVTQKYPKITNMEYSVNIFRNDNPSNCMEEGFVSQLQSIAPNLKSLNLKQLQYIPYTFPTLDRNECQLKELTIGLPLSEDDVIKIVTSEQSQFIQKLSLARVRADHFLEHLTGLTALKSLHFSYRPNIDWWDKLDMKKLLDAIGDTITTLEIGNAKLSLLPDEFITTKYSNVKTLILKECYLPWEACCFISKSFPELQNLIIYYCSFNMSTFDLGGLNLSYLEFRDPISPTYPYILVETSCNGEKRWYFAQRLSPTNRFPSGHRGNFPAIKSFSKNMSYATPYVTFRCNSLQEFMLVNTPPPT